MGEQNCGKGELLSGEWTEGRNIFAVRGEREHGGGGKYVHITDYNERSLSFIIQTKIYVQQG